MSHMTTKTRPLTTAVTDTAKRLSEPVWASKIEIDVPRDRNGDFEPKLLPKNQTIISQDKENKIISMYAKGMSTTDIDIETHIRDI